jgi:maltose alpha-D-glucosyltransferase/alpha-amylase
LANRHAERLRLQFETETLPRHVETQRWYANKGTPVTRARLADHAQWQEGTDRWLLTLIDIEGPSERAGYFVRWRWPGKTRTRNA